jgi:protein-S-isoprenylcysteine O-methyltransferase Ste14
MKINTLLLAGQIMFLFVVFALAFFLPAGTIAWPAAWIFLILFFGFVVALTLWLFRHNPGLLTERMGGSIRSGQKAWDIVFQVVVNIAFLAWLLFMPLDAIRFHWSQAPVWLQALGVLMLLFSFYLFFLTFRENSYLSPVVRIQQDRGQTVVSSGPYHYVRHPMYAGATLFLLGTPLVLGALYGTLIGLLLVVMVAVRAVMEERTLSEELPGYAAYMRKVRYRLIPYVW